ncbi:MAG TPA: hypothetical protein VI248_19790 [Kineosporiaceae bacterium]
MSTPAGTATTYAARDHARVRAGASADAMPYLPPSTYPEPAPDVPVTHLRRARTAAGDAYTDAAACRALTSAAGGAA